MKPISECFLYAILDFEYISPNAAPEVCNYLVAGDVDIIQIRAKKLSPDRIGALAKQLLPITSEAGISLIVNDYPRVAAENGADGVHVGQEDVSIAEARRIVGRPCIAGRSTHSLDQAMATAAERPDYIAYGPVFATPTKPDYQPVGLDDIGQLHELVALPIFCIGGIKRETLDQVIDAGARRVVMVSGILQAPDIASYCQEVKARLAEANG